MFDAIIIIILVLSFVIGVKKGFVNTVFSMLSLLLSSVLVYFLYDTFLSYFSSSEGGKIVSEYVLKNYDGFFADQISAVAVSVVALFILYFVVKLLLKFLIGILDLLSKLPIIKTLNKFLGGLAGLVFGVILVIIITNIASVIPSFSSHVEASEIVKLTDILFIKLD